MVDLHRIEEFYCSEKKKQPVRITNQSAFPQHSGSLYKKKGVEVDIQTRRYNFQTQKKSEAWSSTRVIQKASSMLIPSEVGGEEKDKSLFKLSSKEEKDWEIEEEIKYEQSVPQLLPLSRMKSDIISTTDEDFFSSGVAAGEHVATKSEMHLKQKLTASLSPSPFRHEDQSLTTSKLEKLVATSTGMTKDKLFSPFYGAEIFDSGRSLESWKRAHQEHIVHTLESICLIKKLKPVPPHIIEKKRLPLEKTPRTKKLAVFDLDETLVHCITENIEKADHIISVQMNTGEVVKAGVNVRYFARECLQQLAPFYELIVFTASSQMYADVAIDLIDPKRELFSKRLFRGSCIQTENGLYIKDLRVLNCDLSQTIIIDNAIHSFAFQLDNGIPIIPFYDDKDDRILLKITDYLMQLKEIDDVRAINKLTFCLTELYELDVPSFLKYYLDEEEDFAKGESGEEDEYEEIMVEGGENANTEQIKEERRKSLPFTQGSNQSGSSLNLGKKAQAVIENHLDLLKEELPKYLASQSFSQPKTPPEIS